MNDLILAGTIIAAAVFWLLSILWAFRAGQRKTVSVLRDSIARLDYATKQIKSLADTYQ